MGLALETPVPELDVRSPVVGRTALKGFFGLADDWGLSSSEQRTLLGEVSKATLSKYRGLPEVALSRDTLDRISYLFGIHKNLMILFGRVDRAARWLRAPNQTPPFNGQPALEVMLRHGLPGLALVRQYLDASRG